MGFTPTQVKEMTMWEFMACSYGWNKAHSRSHSVEGDPIDDDAYERLCDLGDMWNGGS